MRELDSAYRRCDPDRHILGALGHVSGNARKSRDTLAPPFGRLGADRRIAATNVLNATFSWNHGHLRLLFVVALSGCALVGCAAHSGQQGSSTSGNRIPLPSSAAPRTGLCAEGLGTQWPQREGCKPSPRTFLQIRRLRRPTFCAGPCCIATKPDSRPSQLRRELSGAHKAGVRAELLPAG